ncbi:hypothetical protein JF50_08685 [Pseudoalteromonas luteoviolacea]|uniref:Uncharacterized protein n=1 Tax=Pseudoalteromonas luteoviolacea TaxID=43657 RepID=A0A0C1QQD8_9GAMM|nr:hypothetical protein [Pseudoalteromonas luteoviolacea]KID57292.1 hypothetical protein JF50_08685 [Pseudoalteromonas luteoviolacea]
MIKFIETTPWWFLILLYVTTLALGTLVGAPLVIQAYDLPNPVEVTRLFVLVPLIKVHYLLPLLLLVTFGLKYVKSKQKKQLTLSFIVASIMLVPVIFYGLQLSDIYLYAET